MAARSPVALIIFSNDLDNFLSNIETERKLIEEALEHYDDNNRLKVITRSSVSIEELFRLFNRYSGRIVLFHFSGHAGGNGLQFNRKVTQTETGKAAGIANLIGREAKAQLKFVFLNGCSTTAQVQQLKAVGVPNIIATHYPISDNQAVGFSRALYRSWAKSDKLTTAFDTPFTTLRQAFDDALAFLKMRYTIHIEEKTRGFSFDLEEVEDDVPWELFTTQPEQTLEFETGEESKTFNEFLIRRLIERLVPYSRPAARFLPIANKKVPDWETIQAISKNAKAIIVYSFVGVLGIQLQKLFAIGTEEGILPETRQRKYIDNCIFTAKRTFKLVNFAFLSKLWDIKSNQQTVNLTEQERSTIQHFFEDGFEMDILAQLQFLKTLYGIFKSNNLELPFSGLEHFDKQLTPKSSLTKACQKLQTINQRFDKSQIQLSDCFAAEKQLVTVLETFIFLAAYKMVSIRKISYDEMRNQTPRYIHNYTILGIDAKQNVNSERMVTDEVPINTDAILLYKGKGRYQESLNLFPFIIDMNTLTFENKAKVCFYDSKDFGDGSLNYRFLKDNKISNIVFEDIESKEPNVAKIIADEELFKTLKLDMVSKQFYEAQKVILSVPDSEEDDDFGDLFDEEEF